MSKSGHTRLPTESSNEHRSSPVRNTRRVLIVAVPPVRTLDVFGPLEVFGDANRSRATGRFTKSISSRAERIGMF